MCRPMLQVTQAECTGWWLILQPSCSFWGGWVGFGCKVVDSLFETSGTLSLTAANSSFVHCVAGKATCLGLMSCT